ncbi:triple QxxK/R motif-containing protein isoform X1 [Entelurus aequoreus]|uniref:triple QxxK/R motif-containing protein isoform X1 n=1 Tax=Entelurus aequoreus TaxID=161455 RepID=UPI002B1D7D3B|nr:triple QxxK/R motif-containing protein isoform X1 [Entelurus aequoreus]XP_061902257.1 triple QxxK/R motif-containing protein isoform X1 [Entelurus aequoreus]
MGRKDASATKLPVDQYRKQIGKQDYKKTKSVLKATRLKAEAKKNSSAFRPSPSAPTQWADLLQNNDLNQVQALKCFPSKKCFPPPSDTRGKN